MNLEDLTLDVEQHVEIKGTPDKVFAKMLDQFGKNNTRPDGESLNLILEAKPGGRWYRDRGDGIGHLWGFVQAIKPPVLLELSGPMFMSYPAINHVEIKVEEVSGGCKVSLRHRAIGMIDPEHRKGVTVGWGHMLSELKKDSEK
jgi:hypothetical protein